MKLDMTIKDYLSFKHFYFEIIYFVFNSYCMPAIRSSICVTIISCKQRFIKVLHYKQETSDLKWAKVNTKTV